MVDIEHIFDNIDTSALAPEVIASFQDMLLYIAELEKGADAEDVSSDDLVALFDQRHITSTAKTKWYSPNAALGDRSGATRLTKKKGICFHHTAVRGGFGADKSLVRKYEREPVDMDRFRSSTRPLTTDEWARALALFRLPGFFPCGCGQSSQRFGGLAAALLPPVAGLQATPDSPAVRPRAG